MDLNMRIVIVLDSQIQILTMTCKKLNVVLWTLMNGIQLQRRINLVPIIFVLLFLGYHQEVF